MLDYQRVQSYWMETSPQMRTAVRAHSLTLLHVLAFHVEDVQYGIKYPTPVKLLQWLKTFHEESNPPLC